jgi:hypothetical protein
LENENLLNYFLLVYLESVDVNGDEYQNIEIAIDPVPNTTEISTDNLDTNQINLFNSNNDVSNSF